MRSSATLFLIGALLFPSTCLAEGGEALISGGNPRETTTAERLSFAMLVFLAVASMVESCFRRRPRPKPFLIAGGSIVLSWSAMEWWLRVRGPEAVGIAAAILAVWIACSIPEWIRSPRDWSDSAVVLRWVRSAFCGLVAAFVSIAVDNRRDNFIDPIAFLVLAILILWGIGLLVTAIRLVIWYGKAWVKKQEERIGG